jgi:glutamyl-tRNA reductase
MKFVLFGLNHKSAPVHIREKLAHLDGASIPHVNGHEMEAVVLSTCNRVEIYYAGSLAAAGKSFTELLTQRNLNYSELKEYFYEKTDYQAINHLFLVSAGVDSMVLGENQILHQIKEAYKGAIEKQLVGKQLHSLFQKALEVGKRVRSNTSISQNPVSIASAAVDLAKNIFKDLTNLKALIIGAGEMANLVAVHLKENGVRGLSFINRTQERAQELAKDFEGQAYAYNALDERLMECDIVISSTSAPHYVIDKDKAALVMEKRGHKSLFMIDIAVPRDIDEACNQIQNIFLYNVDNLRNVVNESLSMRQGEAIKAKEIVEEETLDFLDALEVGAKGSQIKALQEKAQFTRQRELDQFFNQHPELTEELQELFKKHSYSLMGKWLHEQIVAIKSNKEVKLEHLKSFHEVLKLSPTTISRLKGRAPRAKGKERKQA